MKAMILCAGLGSRLKPWTERHPKALVPVGGVPMLKRVSDRLIGQGYDEITLNVHHFADQIIEFVRHDDVLADKVRISDESGMLLDTGGGILNAERFLAKDGRPFLVHNVDILSNADLRLLMEVHMASGRNVTLLVSDRKSDRKLVFGEDMSLKGWINCKTGSVRPEGLKICDGEIALSFSGIYIMDPAVLQLMRRNGFNGSFPVMDFLLSSIPGLVIGGVCQKGLELLDIGKPDTLHRADLLFQ